MFSILLRLLTTLVLLSAIFTWGKGEPVSPQMFTIQTIELKDNSQLAATLGAGKRENVPGDTNTWATVRMKGEGFRLLSASGREILVVDQHNGIYLEGDLYYNRHLISGADISLLQQIAESGRTMSRTLVLSVLLSSAVAATIAYVVARRTS